MKKHRTSSSTLPLYIPTIPCPAPPSPSSFPMPSPPSSPTSEKKDSTPRLKPVSSTSSLSLLVPAASLSSHPSSPGRESSRSPRRFSYLSPSSSPIITPALSSPSLSHSQGLPSSPQAPSLQSLATSSEPGPAIHSGSQKEKGRSVLSFLSPQPSRLSPRDEGKKNSPREKNVKFTEKMGEEKLKEEQRQKQEKQQKQLQQEKSQQEKENGVMVGGEEYAELKTKMAKLFEKEREKGRGVMTLRELQPSDLIAGCLMCGLVHVWRKREWKQQKVFLFDESCTFLSPSIYNLYFYQELDDGELHRSAMAPMTMFTKVEFTDPPSKSKLIKTSSLCLCLRPSSSLEPFYLYSDGPGILTLWHFHLSRSIASPPPPSSSAFPVDFHSPPPEERLNAPRGGKWGGAREDWKQAKPGFGPILLPPPKSREGEGEGGKGFSPLSQRGGEESSGTPKTPKTESPTPTTESPITDLNVAKTKRKLIALSPGPHPYLFPSKDDSSTSLSAPSSPSSLTSLRSSTSTPNAKTTASSTSLSIPKISTLAPTTPTTTSPTSPPPNYRSLSPPTRLRSSIAENIENTSPSFISPPPSRPTKFRSSSRSPAPFRSPFKSAFRSFRGEGGDGTTPSSPEKLPPQRQPQHDLLSPNIGCNNNNLNSHQLVLSPLFSPMKGGGGMMKLDLGGEGEKKCTKHQRLLVELVEAKDYLSKNKQEEIAPFVVLHCFGERKRAGNIHRSILNPFWGEQYAFNVQGGCQRREGERLTATILVENEGKGKDYPLGDVEVDVGRVKEEGVVREWFPLSGQDVGKSYVDGELQVFLGLLSSSMLEGGKEGWFLDVHIAKLRNFLTKRSGISEIFIRFQVGKNRYRTRPVRRRLTEHLFCEHFLVLLDGCQTSFDIQLGIYGVYSDPLLHSGAEVLLGVATLVVLELRAEKMGRGKEFWCCFSRPNQKENGETSTETTGSNGGGKARLLMRLEWEEFDLIEGRGEGGEGGFGRSLLEKKYEGVVLADRVLGEWRDELVGGLVPFLVRERHILSFINIVAKKEVEETLTSCVLFRGNTLLTKTIDQLQKIILRPYIHSILRPWLHSLSLSISSSKTDIELDPTRLDKEKHIFLPDHRALLLVHAHSLLTTLFQSSSAFPPLLKMAYATIQKHVVAKFPNDSSAEFTSVSSFFFLRFICPCLVSPKSFGVVSRPPGKGVTRGLTLLAKVVQNLANLVEFGEKEGFMAPLNPFLVENMGRMKVFLKGLGRKGGGEGGEVVPAPAEEVLASRDVCLGRLFKLFYDNLDRLKSYKGGEEVDEKVRERLVQALEITKEGLEKEEK